MKKKLTAKPAGERFALIFSQRWEGSQVAFMRAAGVAKHESQQFTLWKLRGVPARLANKAALLLKCKPSDISDVDGDAPETPKGAVVLTGPQEMLLAACADFTVDQFIKLIQAAGSIKNGLPLATGSALGALPEAREPTPIDQTKATQAIFDHAEEITAKTKRTIGILKKGDTPKPESKPGIKTGRTKDQNG